MSKSSPLKQSRTTDDDFADAIDAVKNAASEAMDNAANATANINEKLKTVGVDAGAMADAAKEQASELQRLLTDELKARPMRTLGVAAAVGFIAALLVTR